MIKKKLLLIETEMRGPGGHYLDNLIESFFFFQKDFNISALLNKKFNSEGTYIPKELNINKIINRNNFEKKENKFLHYLFELFIIFKCFSFSIILIPYFIIKKNFLNYLIALISNKFILPRYFTEIFFFLKKNNFSENDHIFFQTTRNKHMSLANFLIRLNIDIPKIHLRVLYTPVHKRFGGFYSYLNKIKFYLMNRKICLYVLTKKNYDILVNYLNNPNGVYLSNIPWVFYERINKNDFKTVGYMGDARISRGFNYLPKLINELTNISKDFRFIIQYSKVNKEIKSISDEIHAIAKRNSNVTVYFKYMDYKEFRDTLQKIDIMPILHNADEINLGNPSTIYSSITHEIPMTLPSNSKYMKNALIYKSYEEADTIEETIKKINLIKNNYDAYLLAAKKNSKILLEIFNNDPLKENIR